MQILKDKTSQGSRGFAFIHYEDVREAMNAVSDMCEGKQLPGNFDGRTVKCSYSRRQALPLIPIAHTIHYYYLCLFSVFPVCTCFAFQLTDVTLQSARKPPDGALPSPSATLDMAVRYFCSHPRSSDMKPIPEISKYYHQDFPTEINKHLRLLWQDD